MSPALCRTCAPINPDLNRVDYATWDHAGTSLSWQELKFDTVDQLKQAIVMHSTVTSKKKSWPGLIWPTLYIINNCASDDRKSLNFISITSLHTYLVYTYIVTMTMSLLANQNRLYTRTL